MDDEEQIRELVKEVLEMNGYTVVEAPDPYEALSICEQRRGRIDLLLTDIVMPGMDGPDLYRRLAPRHPELRILYMSGYSDGELNGRRTFREGDAFIQKPFDLAALARKVRDVLDVQPVTR